MVTRVPVQAAWRSGSDGCLYVLNMSGDTIYRHPERVTTAKAALTLTRVLLTQGAQLQNGKWVPWTRILPFREKEVPGT